MKKTLVSRFLLSLFISLLILSCVKEEQNQPTYSNSEAISVFGADAQSDPETKTSLDGLSLTWNRFDQIGIFSDEARPSADGEAGVSNVVYEAQSNAARSNFTGEMYWGTGPHSFYAYYPYKSAGVFTQANVPVQVKAVQTQSGATKYHLAEYDFLVATPVTVALPDVEGQAASVDFLFNHLFTLLEFKVTTSTPMNITEIELVAPEGEALSISGTVNITLPTPAKHIPYVISTPTVSNSVKLNITGVVTSTSDPETTPSIFMMINPSDLTGKNITINVKAGTETVQTVTRTGINFKRGVKYLVNVTENLTNFSIPVGTLDFDQYPSYEIWDDTQSKKIGEIFKEYLFKYDSDNSTSLVREAAIVAYPVNSSGELDITNGLVVTNGGSVAWNTNITSATAGSDMITSYTDGGLAAMPSTIYLAAGSSKMRVDALDPVAAASAIVATFVPMTVRDQRSGPANNAGNTEEDYTYNVVKVGSQFWMQENLKTSRFADGTNIATNFTNSEWMAIGSTGSPGCLVTGTVTANTYINANASSAASARDEYGCQYNHSAIINETLDLTGSDALTGLFTDKISISGWSVPTVAQFEILWRYIVQASNDAATDPMPELYANATGELANITGFSAKGSRSRGIKTGGYNTATYYKTMSYKYGISGIHETTMFRIDAPSGQTVFRQLELGTGAYVRCIRK